MLTNPTIEKKHRLRTFFASLFATLGVCLVLASIGAVWLNETLTNTNVYVSTVASLIKQPAVQNFVAQKAAAQLIGNIAPRDAAAQLLSTAQIATATTDDQLKALVSQRVQQVLLTFIQSPGFQTTWQTTNEQNHAALVAQLDNNAATQLTLNFTPAINSVIAQLKSTGLSNVAGKIDVPQDAGLVVIKDSSVSKLHQYYHWAQQGTIALVAAAVVLCALAALTSVHHGKTLRRMLLMVGILALILAAVLAIPAVVTIPHVDAATQAMGKAVVQVLTHNLLIASLVIGTVCIAGSIGSKIYSSTRSKAS